MKITLALLMSFFYCEIISASVQPVEAKDFLKSVKCEFSAFLTSPQGRVASVAICAESFKEGARKGCMVRGANIEEGVYTSEPRRGDLRRVDGSFCSKAAIEKILSTNFYRRELKGQTSFIGGTWTVVDDPHGVTQTFLAATK